MPTTPRRLLPAAALLLVAAACSSSSPTDGSAPGLSVEEVELKMYRLVNDDRVADGQQAVAMDPALREVARSHSQAMRDQGFFGHVDPGGSDVFGRLAAAGLSYGLVGENLSLIDGTSDPAAAAHQQLMTSPPHKAIVLDSRFDSVGIGVARSGDRFWFTQIFVRR